MKKWIVKAVVALILTVAAGVSQAQVCFEPPVFERPLFEHSIFERPRFDVPLMEPHLFQAPLFEKSEMVKAQFERPQMIAPQFDTACCVTCTRSAAKTATTTGRDLFSPQPIAYRQTLPASSSFKTGSVSLVQSKAKAR